MASQTLRQLVFTRQPPEIVFAGETWGPLQVAVLDGMNENETTHSEKITITLEDGPTQADATRAGPLNGSPKRLRASAPGCADAVSNIFCVMPKPRAIAR